MSTVVSWNSVSYTVPATGEENWGGTSKVDGLLISLATNGFNKAGGTFTLAADADFGATAGLKSIYYKSRAATVASAGVIRLGNAETIAWDNIGAGNTTITVNASDQLVLAATVRISSASGPTLAGDGGGFIVTSAGTRLTSAGDPATPDYSFSGDSDTGMYRVGANNIGLAVNGVKIIDVAGGGPTVSVGDLTLKSTVTGVARFLGALTSTTVAAPDPSTATVVLGTNPAGLYLIQDNNTNKAAVFLFYGSSSVKIGGDAVFTHTSNTGASINITNVTGTLTIQNKTASALAIGIVGLQY